MTLDELKRLVALGEGYHLEFKRRVPKPERIAKEIIAFANSNGGILLLGVSDDGTISGLRDVVEEQFDFERSLREFADPVPAFRLERVPVSHRREVLVVHVPESHSKPHYLPGRGNSPKGTAYVRVKDMSVEASREVIRLMRAPDDSDVRFEYGDKEHALMQYLDQYEKITVDQFASLVDVPRRVASRTLVLLTRASILQIHPTERADYFSLAYDTAA